ncbi:hypothetical protein SAMN05421780_101566 [Flexibacter flexilis DSM 6793]|uniref:Uncharacterized protein n=1 Tax=Flexibacter flexilis DSM 6793 TaxID=927664 RepID=A0A1I1E718_9BACT|nr:hypothetical protein [Flexibacter flexilis]SFB80733.1 hypothetical protein SAMN05421780_101566 [Flexibacter flexilis DSM 6793]
MTRKYAIQTTKYTEQVVFEYDEESGLLVGLHIEAGLPVGPHEWILEHLPRTTTELQDFVAAVTSPHTRVIEVPHDLSFERFWDQYTKKVNKARCIKLFEKLSDADKLKAITTVTPYLEYCKRTGFRGVADPEKYLNAGYYETDWKRER